MNGLREHVISSKRPNMLKVRNYFCERVTVLVLESRDESDDTCLFQTSRLNFSRASVKVETLSGVN